MLFAVFFIVEPLAKVLNLGVQRDRAVKNPTERSFIQTF